MQIDIKQPHDSIFKNVFDDTKNTKDFLKAYLPTELVEQIEYGSPTPSVTIKPHKTKITTKFKNQKQA